ncbi:OmpA family protein [Sphingomonas sp. ASV193]|uniref:OmpA family protein n=1 Tax=Sphingomonas sp. ASV193 TaxID=3144405 RepID=UPI0032E87E27
MKRSIPVLAFLVAPAATAQSTQVNPEIPKDPQGRSLIFFDWNKSNISGDASAVLDRIAAEADAVPSIRIELVGQSDRSGSDASRRLISRRRSSAVKTYLVAHGVRPSAISISESKPTDLLVPTEAGVREAQNRFVAMRLLR